MKEMTDIDKDFNTWYNEWAKQHSRDYPLIYEAMLDAWIAGKTIGINEMYDKAVQTVERIFEKSD